MGVFFLDTSAVIKRYVQETRTVWMQSLTSPAAGHLHCLARVTRGETVAAIAEGMPVDDPNAHP
jgi:hypothetical protein